MLNFIAGKWPEGSPYNPFAVRGAIRLTAKANGFNVRAAPGERINVGGVMPLFN